MDPVVHFEFPYDDRERIVRFYQSAFGWELQKLGEDMGNYVVATTAEVRREAEARRAARSAAASSSARPTGRRSILRS